MEITAPFRVYNLVIFGRDSPTSRCDELLLFAFSSGSRRSSLFRVFSIFRCKPERVDGLATRRKPATGATVERRAPLVFNYYPLINTIANHPGEVWSTFLDIDQSTDQPIDRQSDIHFPNPALPFGCALNTTLASGQLRTTTGADKHSTTAFINDNLRGEVRGPRRQDMY